MQTWLITGGAGFIGSNFILKTLSEKKAKVVNLDKLTYAGNLKNLESVVKNPDYEFVYGDIGDKEIVQKILNSFQPHAIINFAAESHVDRSIDKPEDFIHTNILGTYHLLEASKKYWEKLSIQQKQIFRFLHISTDEVYGSLDMESPPFSETNQYQPNSPYAASKASSDHLVRAYSHTYQLPVFISNCSNNYGPYQFPEKLIPLTLLNATTGKSIPIYGDGSNVRDWLYVEDHCRAIHAILDRGKIGECYNIGGLNEKTNLEIVNTICSHLDEILPHSKYKPHQSLIRFVKDRPGHDKRYAINPHKIIHELNWKPIESFETGIRKTIQWYIENQEWIKSIQTNQYREWIEKNYFNRTFLS